MAATRSAVDFCNRALASLGHDGISALLASESTTAAACVSLYEPTKEALLGEFPWRFAIKRRQVSLLSDAPPSPWTKQFTLPSDFILLQRTDEALQDFELYADPMTGQTRLYTCDSVVYVDYVADVAEAYFPAHFQDALVARLTSALCMPITEDPQRAAYWMGAAKDCVRRAKVLDANQVPARRLDDLSRDASLRFAADSGAEWT